MCWHTYRGRSIWNIGYDYGIRSNPRMAAYCDRPQNLGSRTDVHVATDSRYATIIGANRYLLEQQAIRADFSVRVDDYAIRMRQRQTASQFAIQRNVGAGHHAPTSVPQYCANPRQ